MGKALQSRILHRSTTTRRTTDLSRGADPHYGRAMRRHVTPLLAATVALALTAATPAAAKAPPKGKYDCTIGGSTLFGTLTIKGGGAYRHRGSTGRYVAKGGQKTYPDGVVGFDISFRKGTLGGMKGRWYKGKDGTPEGSYEIALRNPRDDFESIYCTRRK
jgi:hypothetical protein